MDTGHKVLVIDDDPIYAKITTAILEAHGYQVDCACGGTEGLRKMAEEKPDLVLLDVMMDWPMEGVRVSRDMMDSDELSRIPIIMITSIKSSEYRGSFPLDQYLHIDSWLDKPCSPERLLSEVQSTIARFEKHKKDAAGQN